MTPSHKPLQPEDEEKTKRRRAKLERKQIRLDIFKKWFEMVAIFIGAVWAYYNFYLKDLPDIDKSLRIERKSIIEKDLVDSINTCFLKNSITLKNAGKLQFEVTEIKLYLWYLPAKEIQSKEFFDVNKYMRVHDTDAKVKLFTQADTDVNPLLGVYRPDDESDHDFPYFIKKDPNKAVIFKAEITVTEIPQWWCFWRHDTETISFNEWHETCEPESNKD